MERMAFATQPQRLSSSCGVSALPLLKDKSVQNLRGLRMDQKLYNAFLHSFDPGQHLDTLRDDLRKGNNYLATCSAVFRGATWMSGFGRGVREAIDFAVEKGSGNALRREFPKWFGDMRQRDVPKGDSTGNADDSFLRSRLAVFLSGGGSNFRALHASTLSNKIFGDVVVVVSDKPGCKGCEYAKEQGIPVLAFPRSAKHAPDGLSASDLVEALRNFEVDYVLLAGYLKLIPEELVRAYPRSVLNIHPALLPAFGGKGYFGMKVHEAVIKSGARFSGPTVHFVDENYDSGPILAQRIVPVLADDSAAELAARVLKEEHVLYSEAVAALCEDRVFWREDGVPLIRRSWDGTVEYY